MGIENLVIVCIDLESGKFILLFIDVCDYEFIFGVVDFFVGFFVEMLVLMEVKGVFGLEIDVFEV